MMELENRGRPSIHPVDRSVGITNRVMSLMESHAAGSRPAECCGLLSGNGGLIRGVYPLRNEATRPETGYFASPEDLLAAMREIRVSGESMMGIYHSHPRSPAYPSPSDIEMAFYPDAFYFIISLDPRVDIRAFSISRGRVREVAYAVEHID
ncbi:MAG TPA: M67 family metallopeptidase [Blastocatellia bacterium]|nr:M67 family metallopeptidase [Blastocatellia bacterium]